MNTESFGPFKPVRTLDSADGTTIYEARKEGDPKGVYFVKVFSPERLQAEERHEAGSDLDPQFKDLGSSFIQRINLQKQAAESSPLFAPILAAGHDARGAWYVTRFYRRSLGGMLRVLVGLEAPDLFHVVRSVLQAALHLKRTAGRSHGNLKPSNVFIAGEAQPSKSQVIVADLLPGDQKEAERYEKADLRALGELIYQSVRKRKVDFSKVLLPVEDAQKEWHKAFGKHAQGWLDLCNELLNPGLSLDTTTLEKVEKKLAGLEPPRSPVLKVTLASVSALFLAVGSIFWWTQSRKASLWVTTDPPGATVSVMQGNFIETKKTPIDRKPVLFRLPPGDYSLRASFPGLADQPIEEMKVGARQTLTLPLNFEYSRLVVLSEPLGAALATNGASMGTTPYTNEWFKPGKLRIKLSKEGHVPNEIATIVLSHTNFLLMTNLALREIGKGLASFKSDPPQASVHIRGARATNDFLAPDDVKSDYTLQLPGGRYEVTATLPGWPTLRTNIEVSPDQSVEQLLYFEHGILAIGKAAPPQLQVLSKGELMASYTPTNLYLPPATYDLTFRADGYYESNVTIVVTDKWSGSITQVLQGKGGFVKFDSDPPGAMLYVTNGAGQWVTNMPLQAANSVPLPKGTYNLYATYPNLDALRKERVSVDLGQTVPLPAFNFSYGTVVISNLQPPDAIAHIRRLDSGDDVNIGQAALVRPGASTKFEIHAAKYNPTNLALVVTKPLETISPSVYLTRSNAAVVLRSVPEGAHFFTGDGIEILLEKGQGQLPWGKHDLIARLDALPSQTNFGVAIELNTANSRQFQWSDYARLCLTNLGAGVAVWESGHFVGSPTNGSVYVLPGNHDYTLMNGARQEPSSTNLTQGAEVCLKSPKPREITNSYGMTLVWVGELPLESGGTGGYVGKCEVSQEQFHAIVGNNHEKIGANACSCEKWGQTSASLPANRLSGKDAMDFCRLLSDKNEPGSDFPANHVYQIPTTQQWIVFAANASTKDAVVRGVNTKEHAEPVGHYTNNANFYLLLDIIGNVAELCRTADGKFAHLGKAFNNEAAVFVMKNKGPFDPQSFSGPEANIGFRVVLVPRTTAATGSR